ncbi:hypothetical protein CUMW_288060 [Citrus unshiu]|uniref:Uncharacterized protein n=1 Tax=Citrus unshiu TaxID=55188 RepID=A0A2H5MYQ8_CITUN|nr:hypothetical protein CUMW_288060 [Citrus unshiu]
MGLILLHFYSMKYMPIPNTPHGGGMSLLHSHFASEKDVYRNLHTIMFNWRRLSPWDSNHCPHSHA